MNLYNITRHEDSKYLASFQNSYTDDIVYFVPKQVAGTEDVKELCAKTPNYHFLQIVTTEMGDVLGSMVEFTYDIGD